MTTELANDVTGAPPVRSSDWLAAGRIYYEDKYVKLYHGNSLEMLDGYEPDSVVTDPPYGVGLKYASYVDTPENWLIIKAMVTGLIDRAKQVALMIGQRQAWEMPKPKWMLCWAKPGSCRRSDLGGFNEWEPVLLYGKWRKVNNDLKWLPNCNNYHTDAAADHPCPKPIKLMTWLVSLTDGVVLDPFAGSGSTLLAAKQLERKAVGIEIEERYCEIAARRMAQEVLPLCTANKPSPD
jgi:site-specific DNA-methyltransferase (adenine-specific)